MTITDDRNRFFWLASAGDAVTATEPEPTTFDGSLITPCIDMAEYAAMLRQAMNLVGTDPTPANNSRDYIYIAGWWLGLLGATFDRQNHFTAPSPGFGSSGAFVEDLDGFDLDPEAPDLKLLDVLIAKARAGVDVRVIGWVSYALLSTTLLPIPVLGHVALNKVLANSIQSKDPGGYVSLNGQTLNSIKALRKDPKLATNTVLNIVGHSAGAIHMKVALVGTKPDGMGKSKTVGFAGGLDFVEDRWAGYRHEQNPTWTSQQTEPRWHDVQAAIEGKAAQGLYDHFRAMWNENLRREQIRFRFEGETMLSYPTGATEIPARAVDQPLLSTGAALSHHVQSLRTVPAFNYHWYNCLPEGKAALFAPNGLFEIRAAWRKAILAAERCIYIEDQAYWSREAMTWVNESIRAHPNLKVILLWPGATDPQDAPADDSPLYHEALNLGLLGRGDPLRELTASQQDRIRLFRARVERVSYSPPIFITAAVPSGPGETDVTTDVTVSGPAIPIDVYKGKNFFLTNAGITWEIRGNPEMKEGDFLKFRIATPAGLPPIGAEYTLVEARGLIVHTKSTIVDDKWTIIGSANCTRRSLYTDWEYSIAFLDEAGSGVRDYRARLWAEHFKAQPVDFHDLDRALGGWESSWNPAGGSPPPPPLFERVSLPVPVKLMTDELRDFVNEIKDVDSRDKWGGICPPERPN